MIHAIEKNKAGRNFKDEQINWRQLFKASEDSLTSSVFERLFYLPVELFWKIITESCYGKELPNFCGPIEGKEFWPHWSADNTDNENFIEPDVFIRFKDFDLIIEAKRYDDKQQNPNQWRAQIESYKSEYEEESKPLYYIALGGLNSEKSKLINEKVWIVKCRWKRILDSAKSILKGLEKSRFSLNSNDSTITILEDLLIVFALHGYSTGEWLETMEVKRFTVNNVEDNIKALKSLKHNFTWKKQQ